MTRDNEPAIEVEVLEIDGEAPSAPKPPVEPPDDDGSPVGPAWVAQVRGLHPLLWPLVLVMGGLLLVVVLTVGLVLGVIFVIYRIIRGLFRALAG